MASAQILQLYETNIIKKTQLSKYYHQRQCIPTNANESFFTETFQKSAKKHILPISFESTTSKCLKTSKTIHSKTDPIIDDNNSTFNTIDSKKWKASSHKSKSKTPSDDRNLFVLARNENENENEKHSNDEKKMPRTAIETNSLPVNKIPDSINNDTNTNTNTKTNQKECINQFSSVLSNHYAFMPSGNVTKTGNQFTGSFKQCSSLKINSNENENQNENQKQKPRENEYENYCRAVNENVDEKISTSTIVSREMQLQTKRNLCCQNVLIDNNNNNNKINNSNNETFINNTKILKNRIDEISKKHHLCYIPAKDYKENLFQPITCQKSKLCSNRMPPLLSSNELLFNVQNASNTATKWPTTLSSNLFHLSIPFRTTSQLSSSKLSNQSECITTSTPTSTPSSNNKIYDDNSTKRNLSEYLSNCPSERKSFSCKFQFYSSSNNLSNETNKFYTKDIMLYSSIGKNIADFENQQSEHSNGRQYSKNKKSTTIPQHRQPQQPQNLLPTYKSTANSSPSKSMLSIAATKSSTPTTTTTIQNNRYYRGVRTFLKYNDLPKIFGAILQLIILFNMLPLLYAVASDFDASELRGGPNPDPRPWIPVVAYLEPLPRPTKSPKCDQTFVSRVGGPQNGTFTAPMLINPSNHSRQCLYIFLAGPKQRVEVIFTSFNLRGNPPDGSAVGELPSCGHEYMDIYTEVQSSDPADLINSPFGGRYCGPIAPRRRISMFRSIALSFFTNKNSSMSDLFEGRYTFINASEYEIGIPIAGSPCSYTITPSMSINKTGALISPTYPGAYPKDMSCTYQFLGESNQRVRLEFRDFDLFFGGPHCPFDYVKVYDGPDNSSALIGTYCGQQRNLVLYSSESSLFVHFYTLPRTANTQNRGFKGIYEFSESFVKLDFIRQNDGIHMRGSECDQKILSRKESTGYVLSPNYPFPYIQKTVCRYFIYGMQDAQHLERVRLEFFKFEIPKVVNNKTETNCSDGYLKVYLKGQETADAYDKFDYELCGNETNAVVSDGPRLAMVFSSGELQGRGFKAKYTFETEYKIPGTAAPDGSCSFTYRSTSKKKGELNSPRYPSNYPSDTNCSYFFLTNRSLEQVTIVFDHFKVKADSANETGGNYGIAGCFEDWLEIYVVYNYGNDRFLGRYCSLTAPGPVESPRGSDGLRIVLHTDHENVASGFKARYMFEAAKSEVGDCGGNYSQEESGIIVSPNYPQNYKGPAKGLASMACNWFITAKNGYKISINFESFSIEGDPALRGCPAAVLRLWTNVESDSPPIELCGEKPTTEHWHYISQGQSARISFITSDKTIGSQGFRIVWTEIQDSGPGPPSSLALLCESTYHFQCNTGYCIADRLRCDGIKNCGPGDDSDEMHCTVEAPKEDHGVLMICSMAAGSFLICLLCTLCHRKRKRRHHRQLVLHRNAAHYDSTTSATGLSSSRRHLQSGGSLAGSLHGINSGTLTIPPAPLPPSSVPPPPHICIAGGVGSGMLVGGLDDDDDDDDEEDNRDLFINDIRFDVEDDDDDDDINNVENV